MTVDQSAPDRSSATLGAEVVAPLPGSSRRRWLMIVWAVGLLASIAALVLAILGVSLGRWLDDSTLATWGAIGVATTYTAALAVRTGGRPIVFGGVALAAGLAVLFTGWPVLRTGAAAMTVVISSVLAVMVTVPAVKYAQAAREAVIAMVVGCVGAVAALGFAPVVSAERYRYTTLMMALILVFLIVFRLGAGFHGLGRRGTGLVLVGLVGLAVSLAYAELLRRYGSPEVVATVYSGAHRVWEVLGALPRPLIAFLGVPALAWGAHMRARRRQGWWITAFGVAATAPAGHLLVQPDVPLAEVGLQVLYSVLFGLLVGYLVVRLDLWFSHTRGSRARRNEEESAIRPEPSRLSPLR